jgi:hypothetical protein
MKNSHTGDEELSTSATGTLQARNVPEHVMKNSHDAPMAPERRDEELSQLWITL